MDQYDNESASPSLGESTGGSGAGTAARMKEQVSDKAADVKDKVTDFGRKTLEKIDNSRQPAADVLEQTAGSLHSGGEKLSGAAHSAADSIQATADYVRKTDVKGMAGDVMGLVRRYPGPSLVAAALLGFLVARGLSNDD
jgi:hypothetical protein